ncbi:MAG: hypothetical protein ACE5ET_00815 [Gammaproteobacteria bacterium]
MKKEYYLIPLALFLLLLGACSSGGGGNSDNIISGVVKLPAQQVALRPAGNLMTRLAAFFIPALHADVIGLAPVPNAIVELVRIDDAGNITAILNSTTSDASGNYTFITNLSPSSDLAVHLPGEATPTRALVSGSNIDITPVSEAVVRSILDDIVASSTTLGNFTTGEVAALVDLVNGMDIDVSTAPTFNDAVTIVRNEAGSLLTGMVKGYGPAGASNALARKNYNVVGESTTLVPPPQLQATSTAGIDHRMVDSAFGFKSTGQLAKKNFGQLSIILSDLSTASFFCDSGSAFGLTFTPASNGQLSILAADGSGAVAGALAADASFMIYPTTNFTAAIDGLGSGFGRGLQLAMRQGTTIPTTGADLNPLLQGDYHFIWSANHMTPADATFPKGTLTTLTGTATLNYDGGINLPDTEGRNAFNSSSTVVEALTVDLATGAVSNSTNTTDTVNGVYEVLPQNRVFAQLGDPATLLGGGGGTADFLTGIHLDPATGKTFSSLAAFSTYVTAGQMGGGGGMNMGGSNCSSGSGTTVGGGGLQMGASNGEGRGMALAAPKTVGLTEANIIGTYNAVAQLTTLTQGTGTATIDSEIDYGTFTFDGAGLITSGTLRYKRSSMNTTDAINGVTTAVSTSSATSTYSGSYFVSPVDGTVTFTLTGGFTTGSGFITNNGDFLALPILSTAAGSGSRGLLLLMRQP